jgi:thiol-disulfide isomerase/thioredoxin
MKYFVLLTLVSVACLAYLVSSSGERSGPSSSGSQATGDSGESDLDAGLASLDDESGTDLELGDVSGLVLMKFGAPWCPPCRAIEKELDSLGQSNLPVEIRKINVDERPDLTRRFNVSGIPKLILFQDGRQVGDLTGYHSFEELSDWIKESASAEALSVEKSAKTSASGSSIVHANPYFE